MKHSPLDFSRFGIFYLAAAAAVAASALVKASPGDLTEITRPPRGFAEQLKLALARGEGIHPHEKLSQFTERNALLADPCKTFQDSLPATYLKGFISVPEDWSKPDGTKIQVFYYGRPVEQAQKEGRTPVVFFNGGPGGDSHSSYAILDKDERGKALSFVYLDQRGTGCSQAYPIDPVTRDTQARLSHYGSRSIVRDAEALRVQLLGAGSKWKAFGQSYGGAIVHRYVESAPEGLLSAHIHGYSIMSDSLGWLKFRIASQHRVVEDYFKEYPDDRIYLNAIRKQIPAKKCFSDGPTQVCGPDLMDSGVILLGFNDSWPTLHEWIGAMIGPDGDIDPGVLSDWVKYFVFGVYDENGFAASVIGQLEESEKGFTVTTGCPALMDQIKKSTGDEPRNWALNECRLFLSMKSVWDSLVVTMPEHDPFTLDSVQASLKKLPSLPFFLYSGRKDVFVPYETFDQEIQALGNRIQYTSFQNTGHEGFYAEPQVWKELSQ